MPVDHCCCRFAEDGETILEWCSIHAALRLSRARMEQALRPFAKIADAYALADHQRDTQYRDEGRAPGKPLSDGHRVSIALGDCRRAREALAPSAPTPIPNRPDIADD